MSSVNRQVKYSGMAAIALTMLAAVTLLAGIAIPAQAQTFTVLYDFAGLAVAKPTHWPTGARPGRQFLRAYVFNSARALPDDTSGRGDNALAGL